MKCCKARLCASLVVCVMMTVALAGTAGCGGDDTVRGAGSIDVPRPAKLVFPEKAAARRGKAASSPTRPR